MNSSEWHNQRPFLYTGQPREEIPEDITHGAVDSSITWFGAFQSLYKLTSVELQHGLQIIGNDAFFGCISLRNIKVPSTVDVIGERAFRQCRSLVELDLPEGIILIPTGTFNGCSSLKKISIPSTVEYIGLWAFAGCVELPAVQFPPGLIAICSYAFFGCTSLRHIIIPPSVERIDKQAFQECKSLASVELADGLETVGKDAFFGCSSLVNICIPATVEEFGCDVPFDECDRLLEVFSYHRLEDSVKSRFDGLPIHKLCYNQAYHPTSAVLEMLRQTLKSDSGASSGPMVDELGLTPFHILAMSARPNHGVFLELMHHLPKDLIFKKDNSVKSPLDYLCLNPSPGSETAIKIVLHATVVSRLKWLGLEQWRLDMKNDVDAINYDDMDARWQQVSEIYPKLATYEWKEAIALLEQASWKVKLNASSESSVKDEIDAERNHRQICRVNCGADIVISNVLPFLQKHWANFFISRYYTYCRNFHALIVPALLVC